MHKAIMTMAAVLLALTATDRARAVDLEFNPINQTVNLGDPATVDIVATGLGAAEFIGGFDVTVTYDDTILSLADVVFSNALGDPLLFEAFPGTLDTPPSINAFNLSLLFDLSGVQSPPADVTLFSLTFDTVSLGTSALNFSFALLSDDFGFELALGQLNTGAITVGAVPEPGTWLLMASGLALLAIRRKRK